MESSLLQAAVQLGIAGLSVAGLIYVSVRFVDKMDGLTSKFLNALETSRTQFLSEQRVAAERHEKVMQEREEHSRGVEAHVRETITTALTQNTIALTESAKVLGRTVSKLDGMK